MMSPSVSRDTRNIDVPLCTGTSGLVTAMQIKNEADAAFDEKYFRPLMTHESPSRVAVVGKTRGSAPPCGSVIEKHEKISPLSSGLRYCSFCCSVPKWARISAFPVSGA